MARVVVLIDNSNVFKHLEGLQRADRNAWCKQYDPMFLAKKLTGKRELKRVIFYCAPPPQELFRRSPQKYAAQNSYYDKVKNGGVEVKFATLTKNSGELFEKNLDTQLTADAIVISAANECDHLIIVANDGDYVSAVEGAKAQGKKVEVAHFKNRFSMDLKQAADITRRLRPVYFKHIDTEQPQLDL